MLKFSLSATTEKIQKNVRFQCVPNNQILLYNTKMTLCLQSNIEAGKQNGMHSSSHIWMYERKKTLSMAKKTMYFLFEHFPLKN